MQKRHILSIILFLVSFSLVNAKDVHLSRKFDYYFYQAMNQKAQGNYEASFDLLQHCLSIDSLNADLHFQLGNYYNTLQQKNLAMDYFRKASQLDKSNFYYAITYATMCLDFKQFVDAAEIYERLLTKEPDNTDLYLYLAETYHQQGDLEKAIQTLDRLEVVVGMNEKISLQKFALYKATGKSNKAFDEVKRYIRKYPNEIKYYILLGNLYLESEQNDDAYLVLTKAKSLDPENPYLISSMANYYEKVGRKSAAESELYSALISPKMNVDDKIGILSQYLSALYQSQKDTGSANVLLDTLIAQHPQEPKLNMMYGSLLMLQNKKEDARSQFQFYADANPTDPTGWEQMLSTTFPDSLNLSIDICDAAITYLPEQPQFYFYKGVSQNIKGEYSKALDTLIKGKEYVSDSQRPLLSDFYGQIGDIYYALGDLEKTFSSYDKALSYKPENVGILNNYSYYLSLEKKDLIKAEKMSSITLRIDPNNPTYLDTYGWILFQQKEYTTAQIYIENAIQYSKEKNETINPEVWEHYADVLYMVGEKEKALEYWMKAKDALKEESGVHHRESSTLDEKIKSKTYIAK